MFILKKSDGSVFNGFKIKGSQYKPDFTEQIAAFNAVLFLSKECALEVMDKLEEHTDLRLVELKEYE